MNSVRHLALACAILVLSSIGRAARAETDYDCELTEGSSSQIAFARYGVNCGDYPSMCTYKVGVLQGETVQVKLDISENLVNCQSGSCCVYVNGSLRSPTSSGHYVIDLKATSYIKIVAGASFPYDYATTYYCQVDYTISATFPTRHTVYYHPGSGDVSGPEASVRCADKTTVQLLGETYYKTGYRQVGWSESVDGAKKYDLNGTVMAYYDYTLYPYWQKVPTYTITYKADSSVTGSAEVEIKTQGVPIALLAKAPFSRTGYVQRGWSLSEGGGLDYAFGDTYTEDANLVLYPYWEIGSPKMTFVPGRYGTGGNLTFTKSVGSDYLMPGEIYVRKGYRQRGWSTKDASDVVEYAFFSSYPYNQHAIFYPVWEPDPAASRLYMVIDISGGSAATSYPVSYLSEVPAGGWTDEYKTEKIVFRRIASQTNSTAISGSVRDETTITKPYYVGIFPVTQRQYELVYGSRPESSYSGYVSSDTLPTCALSYRTLHSYYTKNYAGTYYYNYGLVSPNSFIGRLRARTGNDKIDLPSNAQWIYAARAGLYNGYGISYDASTKAFITDSSNVSICSETNAEGVDCIDVGSTRPNIWGLYEMLGNVQEWGTAHEGSSSDDFKFALHGGNAFTQRQYCTASRISYGDPKNVRTGFRLFFETEEITTPPEPETTTVSVAIPTPVSGLIYKGSAQTGVTGVDPLLTLVSGTVSATAASDGYSATYALPASTSTSVYQWSDGTTANKTIPWSISARSVNDSGVIFTEIPDQTHTGSAITPSITMTYADLVRIKGTDYTLSYMSNTEVGTASISVTGKGNFTGVKTLYFNIVPASDQEPDPNPTKAASPAGLTAVGGVRVGDYSAYVSLSWKDNQPDVEKTFFIYRVEEDEDFNFDSPCGYTDGATEWIDDDWTLYGGRTYRYGVTVWPEDYELESDAASCTVTVPVVLKPEDETYDINAEGEDGCSLCVKANHLWNAVSTNDWIHINKIFSADETNIGTWFTFSVDANHGVARTGKIYLFAGEVKKTITIQQEEGDVEAPNIEIDPYSGSVEVTAATPAAAAAAVSVSVPSEVQALIDAGLLSAANYQNYFKKTAVPKSGATGTYVVTAEIEDDVRADAASSAMSAIVSSAGVTTMTLAVKTGLCYGFTSASALDGLGAVATAIQSGTSLTIKKKCDDKFVKIVISVSPVTK